MLEKQPKGADCMVCPFFKFCIMKIVQFGKISSRVIVVIYIFLTLLFRFFIEGQFQGNFIISILFGGFLLLFLWALIKVDILNPEWFGFEEKPQTE